MNARAQPSISCQPATLEKLSVLHNIETPDQYSPDHTKRGINLGYYVLPSSGLIKEKEKNI